MGMPKTDIKSFEDIKTLVDNFYSKVNEDNLIGWIFNDFAKVNWKAHLPVMYDFWNTILLGAKTYKGQPFGVHLNLPAQKKHYKRWVKLFQETVDEHFSGLVADEAKLRADTISEIFQYKIKSIKNNKADIGIYNHED